MARQKSLIKLEGTIGDLTFYKTKNGGYIVKEKSSISANRIANDPAFQRTRENGAEFGRAGSAGKLLRTVFRPLIQKGADNTVVSRLVKLLMEVIHADTVNDRGLRMVLDAEAELLTGFEFNSKASTSASIFVKYDAQIDRLTGELSITFPSFIPSELIAAPAGATHFKLKCAGAMIDFETGASEFTIEEGPVAALGNTPAAALMLSCNLSAATTKPLFLALGIDFYQRVNGTDYLLSNGAYNGLSIIKVNGL